MCKKINLTHHQKTQYTNPAPAKSGVRIGVRLPESDINTLIIDNCVFFVGHHISHLSRSDRASMMGCIGVSQDTPFLSGGTPIQYNSSPNRLASFGDDNSIINRKSLKMTKSVSSYTTQPTIFNFQSTHKVRIAKNAQGEPLFCLADVARVLNIQDTKSKNFNLDNYGVEKIHLTDKLGRLQQVTFINEPNLYRVIFRSNKAEARQFQDWVFNEVLPAIRKTGSYTAPQQTAPAPEYINSNDWDNLKRLIWICEKEFNCKKSAGLAIWGRLREITGVKSPEKFEVKHLPILAQEFQRILSVIEHYSNIKYQTEKNLIKHILRNGQDEVLELLMNEFAEKSQTFQEDLQKPLFNIFNTDCVKLLNRQ